MPKLYQEKQGYILKRLIALQIYMFFITKRRINVSFWLFFYKFNQLYFTFLKTRTDSL